MEENVYAIRGATTVNHDSPAEVDEAVKELMEKIYKENGITDDDVAFILFSQTRDIRTRNAAAACRRSGARCRRRSSSSGPVRRICRPWG